MKSFRFYLDIDAENEETARTQLYEDMQTLPLCDMFVEVLPSEQISYDEAKKLFGFKDKYDAYGKIVNHFYDYDAYLCKHCAVDVGNDTKEMIRHLMTHTLEELKKTNDGDDFEEEEK